MLGVNPSEVYIADSIRGGYAYHTDRDCPDFPPATKTLTPEDPAFERVLAERDECQWCRYDTLPDLNDEGD